MTGKVLRKERVQEVEVPSVCGTSSKPSLDREEKGEKISVQTSVARHPPPQGMSTSLISSGMSQGNDLIWEPACPQPTPTTALAVSYSEHASGYFMGGDGQMSTYLACFYFSHRLLFHVLDASFRLKQHCLRQLFSDKHGFKEVTIPLFFVLAPCLILSWWLLQLILVITLFVVC